VKRFRWLAELSRDPLGHFLLAGAVLFALYSAVRSPQPIDTASTEIFISAKQVEVLANRYARSRGHQPDQEILNVLVDEYIREEVSYREALALELDQGDPVIRRRLQQKLQFLLEDSNATLEPTDDELLELLQSQPENFAEPARISFQQIFLMSDNTDEAANRATQILLAMQGGESPDAFGDATTLPRQILRATPASIAQTFGEAFANDLHQLPKKQWTGPIQSGFGFHVVYVKEWIKSSDPVLDTARDELRQAFLQQRRLQGLDARYSEIRDRYTVRIEWPD